MCLSGQYIRESHRFLLRFSYLGTRYSGMQRLIPKDSATPERPTIQAVLETALNSSLRLQHPAVLKISSRTDSGVHATINTAHVDLLCKSGQNQLTEEIIVERVNKFLFKYKQDVILREVRRVPYWFHSRFCVQRRTYIYRIAIPRQCEGSGCAFRVPLEEKNHCFAVPLPLNIELMQTTCKLFEGFHDFVAFTNTTKDPKPTIRCINEFSFIPEDVSEREYLECGLVNFFSWWKFTVTARSFLYHQVRRMVGAVIAVGSGRVPMEEVSKMLSTKDTLTWNPRIVPAPAQGLHLLKVDYEPRMLDLNAVPPLWRITEKTLQTSRSTNVSATEGAKKIEDIATISEGRLAS
ncbi:tRNA pseudouridine synthase-like 1 [Varroa destructor]|uniref:tRNA pseudouridine synthase n=1 Tax=Varroa destructor TaxID=109461 RepID=A0A7M7JFD0_VARDE|nr:tRNA pseudouridine synthase-like 1 [Varroa destructor]XP_022650987.1 tRNA pseudouridine synthase-like 1 [Varroa destructor]